MNGLEYLSGILPMRRCQEHICLSILNQKTLYNFVHVDDIPLMPDSEQIEDELKQVRKGFESKPENLEEYWKNSVGNTLYDKFIDTYSKKMWMIDDNKKIDDFGWSPKGVALKTGPREVWNEAISAFPKNYTGYDPYFEYATKDVNVLLNTFIKKWDIPNKKVFFNDEWFKYDVIINTISPDLLFEKCYGELKYVGRDLHLFVLPTEHVFPENIYFLYYPNGEKFTRLVEYKKFTQFKSPTSLVGMEIPSRNGKFYPLPISGEYAIAQKYFNEMPDNVYSIGRAGSYLYRIDIDDCIGQAMDVTSEILS